GSFRKRRSPQAGVGPCEPAAGRWFCAMEPRRCWPRRRGVVLQSWRAGRQTEAPAPVRIGCETNEIVTTFQLLLGDRARRRAANALLAECSRGRPKATDRRDRRAEVGLNHAPSRSEERRV